MACTTVGRIRYIGNFGLHQQSQISFPSSSEEPGTLVQDLIASMLDFAHAAHTALTSRPNQQEAEKMLVAGDIWRVWWRAADFSEVQETMHSMFKEFTGFETKVPGFPGSYSGFEQCMHNMSKRGWTKWSEAFPGWDADIERQKLLNVVLYAMYLWSNDCPYTMFTTDTGYMARGYKWLEAGDILCHLFGCSMPAILRPVPGGNAYRLITFAYVHDFEWWNLVPDGPGVETQNFVLV